MKNTMTLLILPIIFAFFPFSGFSSNFLPNARPELFCFEDPVDIDRTELVDSIERLMEVDRA